MFRRAIELTPPIDTSIQVPDDIKQKLLQWKRESDQGPRIDEGLAKQL